MKKSKAAAVPIKKLVLQQPFTALRLNDGQNYKVEDKEKSGDQQNRVNIIKFAFNKFHDAVEDKTCGDAIGDTVTKSHKNTGKESRYCFVQIIPFDFSKRSHHHDTDHD